MDITPLLAQIDSVLEQHDGLLGGGERPSDPRNLSRGQIFELVSRMSTAVEALTPDGHRYRKIVAVLLKERGLDDPTNPEALAGILRALRRDLEGGYLRRWEELVRAELFDATIDIADHLLMEGHKDAAAVLAGSALEVHLRGLCQKADIPLHRPPQQGRATGAPKLLSDMTQELCNKKVVSQLDTGNLRTWTLLRNQASHGSYGEYNAEQVRPMVDGVRSFMARYPV